MNQINNKNYLVLEIEEVIVREVALAISIGGEKKNTTWENMQIEKYKSVRWAEGTNSWIVLFRSADFLRWRLSPERNLTHNLFFYFQQFFVLILFFPSKKMNQINTKYY